MLPQNATSLNRTYGAACGRRPLRAVALCLAFLAVAVLVASCSAQETRRGDEARQRSLAWPSPPEQARVRYVKAISGPEDIGAAKSLWSRILEVVLGSDFNDIIKPYGVASDSAGRIIVADSDFKRVHIFDEAAGKYSHIDEAEGGAFSTPIGVAVDADDNIYVTDSDKGKYFVYDKKGVFKRSVAVGKKPTGIAVDRAAGLVYAVDTASHAVYVFDLSGKKVREFGARGEGAGQFNYPVDIFVDGRGDVYVVDVMNYKVRIFDRKGAAVGSFGHHGDGTGDFGRPKGIAVDSHGHIYVVDALFDAVQVFDRKGGLLLSFGSIGNQPGSFWLPSGLFIDNSNRIYVADSYNMRVQVFEYVGK